MIEIKNQTHKERHMELYENLGELVGDFIDQTGKLLSTSTILELMKWSFEQSKNPTEINNE